MKTVDALMWVERKAEWINHQTYDACASAEGLKFWLERCTIPEWRTKAEAELEMAKRNLESGIALVDEVLQQIAAERQKIAPQIAAE